MSEYLPNKEVGEKYKAVISSTKCPNCAGEAISVYVKTLRGPLMVGCFSCGYSDVVMWIERRVIDVLKNAKIFNQVWKEGQAIEITLN